MVCRLLRREGEETTDPTVGEEEEGGGGGHMGRGKIEIKKIENATSRQVTFSKRRGGLLKKAHELAVLCDAEVALIVFSSTGKLFEFASSGSMQAILERYSKSSDGVQPGNESEFMGREVVRLRQQLDHLQNSQRHMLGENLSVLTVPDLLLLEQQLDMGVSRVRARKNQLLLEEIDDLRRKEHDLQQVNEDLRKKASTLHQEHELADTSAMVEPVARAIPSVGQGQITRLSSCEPGGSSQTPTVYPTHPNLQDPQTSQTSLHLGKPPLSTSEIDSMHFLPPCCGISESYTVIGRLFWERGVFSGREERSSLGAQSILFFFCALLLYRWFYLCSSVGGSGLHSCGK